MALPTTTNKNGNNKYILTDTEFANTPLSDFTNGDEVAVFQSGGIPKADLSSEVQTGVNKGNASGNFMYCLSWNAGNNLNVRYVFTTTTAITIADIPNILKVNSDGYAVNGFTLNQYGSFYCYISAIAVSGTTLTLSGDLFGVIGGTSSVDYVNQNFTATATLTKLSA